MPTLKRRKRSPSEHFCPKFTDGSVVFAHPAAMLSYSVWDWEHRILLCSLRFGKKKKKGQSTHTVRTNRGEREEDAECKVVQLQARVSEWMNRYSTAFWGRTHSGEKTVFFILFKFPATVQYVLSLSVLVRFGICFGDLPPFSYLSMMSSILV